MDWRGRGTELEVKLHILSNRSAPRFLQWIGLVERLNATERVVKGETRNPSQGFDRSKSKTRGKVTHFSGLRRDVRRDARFLQWIGLVE